MPSVKTEQQRNDHWRCLLVGTFLILCFYLAVGPNRVLPGDEMRFIETSRTFSENLSLNLLKHYEEMSTPLPFIYFGAMGKIIDFEL